MYPTRAGRIRRVDSIISTEAVLLVLLQHFKFTPTGKDIRWNAAAVQYPSVGMGHPELPLMVSMLRP